MIIDNGYFNLKVKSFLESKIGTLFSGNDKRHVELTREQLLTLFNEVAMEVINIHSDDFRLGLQKAFAKARLTATLEEKDG